MNSQILAHDEDKILSITALSRRWNCSTQTALQRIRKYQLPFVCFNEKAKGVRLSAVMGLEDKLSQPVA